MTNTRVVPRLSEKDRDTSEYYRAKADVSCAITRSYIAKLHDSVIDRSTGKEFMKKIREIPGFAR